VSARRRGFILFGILVVVTAVFCYWLPFVAMPSWGVGVGLPTIMLKTEALIGNVLPGFLGYDLTNTLTSMLLVDVVILLIGFAVNRAVSGHAPERFVPKGFVNFIELLVEFWYNQARNALGENTYRVLPMALTIFTFVLTANWIKLIPGVETVGIITCAEEGQKGYPLLGEDATPGTFLLVNGGSLKDRAGTKVTEADLHACEAKYNGTNGHRDYRPPGVIALEARGGKPSGEGEHKETPSTKPATSPATKSGAFAVPGQANQPSDQLTSAKIDPQLNGQPNAAEKGNSELFTVLPFFRPLATDLNMTLALAIIAFLSVEIWGIQALGGAYFFKFINIPALGNLAKKPMGVMDFVVGLVEIISELSRLISLSFRLLGNIFAGGILLAVMTFMVAGVLPIIFYGLELFVGAIQAYVFAILTVMYASQAMTAHHSDEHEEAHAEH